jgi:RNA polymerase sigma-70 factor (ECF subfamily)
VHNLISPAVRAERSTPGDTLQEDVAMIYRFIYAKVGNREDTEDLTSQVFHSAVSSLPQRCGDEQRRSWLYAAARSAVISYWRRPSQHAAEPLEDAGALLFCGAAGSEEVQRTRERAWRVLNALPDLEREVVRLLLVHGYTVDHIGQTLGRTAEEVRTLQLVALRQAARQLH